MKKLCILIILLIFMMGNSVLAIDNNITIIDEQLDFLNIGEIEKAFQEAISDKDEIFPKVNVKNILIDLIKGNSSFRFRDILGNIGEIFFKEVKHSFSLMAKILVITIISTILTNLQSTFENSSVSELANYITYVLIAILVITSFTDALEMAKIAIGKMVGFMQVILPILLTLLTAASGPNTRMLFHPMIILTVNAIGTLINTVIIPLIFFSFIISIISNVSNRLEFSKLSELGRQVISFIISGALTLFIGMITIYGLGSKIDGLTIRTAKFAVDKFIPIIGSFLSDAVEAVVGCSAILKNGLGFIGLLSLLLICILPIIKILALLAVYKIIAIVIQPIGSTNLVEFFNQVGKSLFLVLISLISTATMFFITITIIVEAGNNLLMLR